MNKCLGDHVLTLNFWDDYMLSRWASAQEERAGSWFVGIAVGAALRADSAELPAKGVRYVQADQTERRFCPRGRWLVIQQCGRREGPNAVADLRGIRAHL